MQQQIYIETVGDYFTKSTTYSALHLYTQRILTEFNGGIIPPHDIVVRVCELASVFYNKTITPEMIMQRNRVKELVVTRSVCVILIISQNNISLTDTGKIMRGLHHSTVIHIRRRFMNGYNHDKKIVYHEAFYNLFNVCSRKIFSKNYEWFQNRLSEIYIDDRNKLER